jgi:DNA polymerase
MALTKLEYLEAMGIIPWELKASPKNNPSDWEHLRASIQKCKACALHQSRTQTVFGVGNPNAELMFIGEAPGFYEDQKGEPFVGRAGQLLNAMLQAMGLTREKVFIANILKCRPPNNRDPSKEEVAECTPFLEKQIAHIQPKLLIALGRIAAHYLLNSNAPLNQIRGKIHSFGNLQTPLIVTYHPAYLLRTPRDKGKAFGDLNLALAQLEKH